MGIKGFSVLFVFFCFALAACDGLKARMEIEEADAAVSGSADAAGPEADVAGADSGVQADLGMQADGGVQEDVGVSVDAAAVRSDTASEPADAALADIGTVVPASDCPEDVTTLPEDQWPQLPEGGSGRAIQDVVRANAWADSVLPPFVQHSLGYRTEEGDFVVGQVALDSFSWLDGVPVAHTEITPAVPVASLEESVDVIGLVPFGPDRLLSVMVEGAGFGPHNRIRYAILDKASGALIGTGYLPDEVEAYTQAVVGSDRTPVAYVYTMRTVDVDGESQTQIALFQLTPDEPDRLQTVWTVEFPWDDRIFRSPEESPVGTAVMPVLALTRDQQEDDAVLVAYYDSSDHPEEDGGHSLEDSLQVIQISFANQAQPVTTEVSWDTWNAGRYDGIYNRLLRHIPGTQQFAVFYGLHTCDGVRDFEAGCPGAEDDEVRWAIPGEFASDVLAFGSYLRDAMVTEQGNPLYVITHAAAEGQGAGLYLEYVDRSVNRDQAHSSVLLGVTGEDMPEVCRDDDMSWYNDWIWFNASLAMQQDRVYVAASAGFRDGQTEGDFLDAVSYLRGFTARLQPHMGGFPGMVIPDDED